MILIWFTVLNFCSYYWIRISLTSTPFFMCPLALISSYVGEEYPAFSCRKWILIYYFDVNCHNRIAYYSLDNFVYKFYTYDTGTLNLIHMIHWTYVQHLIPWSEKVCMQSLRKYALLVQWFIPVNPPTLGGRLPLFGPISLLEDVSHFHKFLPQNLPLYNNYA